jgi:hypothetical protein
MVEKLIKNLASNRVSFLAPFIFYPEDGSEMLLRNVGRVSADYKALYPTKQ